MAYMKADEWKGRSLTLQVGRGDVTILDDVKYRDTRLRRYVGMGFLKEVSDDEKSPVVAIPNQKLPPEPKKLAVTRSTPAVEPKEPVEDAMLASFDNKADAAPQAEEKAEEPKTEVKSEVSVPKFEKKSDDGITKSPMGKVKSGGKRTSTKKLDGDKG